MEGTLVGGNCPDREVYSRLGSLERARDRNDEWRRGQEQRDQDRRRADEERDEKLDRLAHGVTRLNTTIWVATGIVGFLVAVAGIVMPLVKG